MLLTSSEDLSRRRELNRARREEAEESFRKSQLDLEASQLETEEKRLLNEKRPALYEMTVEIMSKCSKA